MSDEKRRKVATITGTVTHANERGVRLDDGEQWYNASKYAKPPVLMPAKGSHVTLTVDDLAFVYKVEPAADTLAPSSDGATPAPQSAAPTPSGYERHDRLVCREWAVNAALVASGSGAPGFPAGMDYVMALAERLAAWAQGDAPWVPTIATEPPRTPDSIPGVRKGVPQPARAPGRPGVGAAGTPGPVEDTPEPPDDEYGPPVQRPAFEPPPREPELPEVEPQADDEQPATREDLEALAVLRKGAAISKELVASVCTHHRINLSKLTRGDVRRLAAWFGAFVPAAVT